MIAYSILLNLYLIINNNNNHNTVHLSSAVSRWFNSTLQICLILKTVKNCLNVKEKETILI